MPTRPLVTSYRQDLKLFPDRWHHLGLLLAAVVIVGIPCVANAYWLTIANDTLVTIVGAVAMMILTGYTGQISLGHAAFIALGAYTAGIFGGLHLPFWLAIPAAGLVAAGVGCGIAVPEVDATLSWPSVLFAAGVGWHGRRRLVGQDPAECTDATWRGVAAPLLPASTAPIHRQISRHRGTRNMGDAPRTRKGTPGNMRSHTPP